MKAIFKNIYERKKVDIYPFIPRDKLFEYLATADICVVPSIWDNSPYAIYETMAAGKQKMQRHRDLTQILF